MTFWVMGHVEKRVTTVNFWVCSLITEWGWFRGRRSDESRFGHVKGLVNYTVKIRYKADMKVWRSEERSGSGTYLGVISLNR